MSVTELNRGRRLEPDERRDQILACAVRLFGERPYSEVSTAELAQEAGVTRGLLHHYFGTKRGLYLEVVRAMLLTPQIDGVVSATGSTRKRVEQLVDWLLDTVLADSKTFVAVTGAEGVGGDPDVEALLARADDAAARAVLEVLGADAPSDRSSAEMATMRAFGQLLKGCVREHVRDGQLTRDQMRLILVESLIAVLKNVLPKL